MKKGNTLVHQDVRMNRGAAGPPHYLINGCKPPLDFYSTSLYCLDSKMEVSEVLIEVVEVEKDV